MKRRFDWRSRLYTALDTFAARPFVWGSDDCTHFAAAMVEAMTDANPLDDVSPGAYDDAESAAEALSDLGYGDLASYLAETFEEVPIAYARVGDIAVVDSEGIGEGLGIVLGEFLAVRMATGIGRVPRTLAIHAFRVP